MEMQSLTTMISPTLPTFLAMFALIYLLGYAVVFRRRVPARLPEASSCLISLAHGTPALLMAVHAIWQSQPSSLFASPNTAAQSRVLDFSLAYFAVDLAHYAVFLPRDALFIAHHAATLYVFATCRFVVGRGAAALLVLLALAEASSACQNAWAIAGMLGEESAAARRVHGYLSPRFYAMYSFLRGFLGPLFALKMWSFFINGVRHGGDDNAMMIPMWAWVSWMAVITAAILASVSWVLVRWVDWFGLGEGRLKMKEV